MKTLARIPFVGSEINRNQDPSNFLTKDQRFINCYPEVVKNSVSGKTEIFLNKRPGFQSTAIAPSGYNGSFGMCMWTGRSDSVVYNVASFCKAGSTNEVKVYYGTTLIGTITGANSCRYIGETTISGVSNIVILVVDSATGYIFAHFYPEGGALTAITNANYPTKQASPLQTVGDPVFLGGYMFIMCRNGQIWNSDINSLANWSANSFITADSMPDIGVGLGRSGDYILAFGSQSIQAYKNTGFPSGSPLSAVPTATINIGAYDGFQYNVTNLRAIIDAGDWLYFIGVDRAGVIGFYSINGITPQKVSTPFIDKLLNQGGAWHIAGTFGAHGMTHILLNSIAFGTAYCYCIQTGIWWEFATDVSFGNLPVACAGSKGIRYATFGSSESVFKNNSTTAPVYQDDSTSYSMTVQTDPIDHGTSDRKSINLLRIIGDTQPSTSNLAVSYSDDDYANFSTARNIDLSAEKKELWRLGSYINGRAWKFSHSANTPCRLKLFEIFGKVAEF